jgi:ribosomal protein L12E/L44/L45/RPP1/RPP2
VQQHAGSAAADREAILRVLSRSEVKTVAEKAGIDLRRATSAVATLEGEDLARVAAQANQVDQALAGGQSRVVISTTLIIIALLVIILIIVAVD